MWSQVFCVFSNQEKLLLLFNTEKYFIEIISSNCSRKTFVEAYCFEIILNNQSWIGVYSLKIHVEVTSSEIL